jgi:hypothetical protein
MKTVPEIIDLLGGYQAVAPILGCKKTAAKEMKRRAIIPVWYWPKLRQACRERRIGGVTYERLVELHQKATK